MGIYDKLLTVQLGLKAPKSQYNNFGKYNYRNCEDILEAVKPHLSAVRAVILLSDAIEQVGERYYVRATATFVDCEDPAQTVAVTAYAREDDAKKGMDSSQVTGATSSYARKYALNGLLDIDDTKDSDTTNTNGNGQPTQHPHQQQQLQHKHKQEQVRQERQQQNPPDRLISQEMATRLNEAIINYSAVSGLKKGEIVKKIEEIVQKRVAEVDDMDAMIILKTVGIWVDRCIAQEEGV